MYLLLKINDLFKKIVSERLHFYIFIYLYRLLDNLPVRMVYMYIYYFYCLTPLCLSSSLSSSHIISNYI